MWKKSHSCAAFLRPSFSLQLASYLLHLSSSFLFFFVARCLYRNPFSLLVRVIRGFKTAFHHQDTWRGLEEDDVIAVTRRRKQRRGRRQWRKRGENSCREQSTEWLDANRPASFDGLSVEKEADRSARIYRYCICHWHLQLARQASRRWRDIGSSLYNNLFKFFKTYVPHFQHSALAIWVTLKYLGSHCVYFS